VNRLVAGCPNAAGGAGQRLDVRRVDRADVSAEMARAVQAVGRFWTDHVDTDTPPEHENPRRRRSRRGCGWRRRCRTR
jgi:hypothetical protein